METILNLENKSVTKGTVTAIRNFLYNNKCTLNDGQKIFYMDVVSLMERDLTKKSSQRRSMAKILETAYNIEAIILDAGALSVETVLI